LTFWGPLWLQFTFYGVGCERHKSILLSDRLNYENKRNNVP